MKESLWGYWLVLLGIMIISVMILLQNYTTTNQQDYYLAKEVTYAAMYDAIDYGYYKKHGELKIIKEKFVENFVRRFAENATLNKTYKVNIYTIYELPPAVSIEIITSTGDYRVGEEEVINAGITTRLTAILELSSNSTVVGNVVPFEPPIDEDEGGGEEEEETIISATETYYDFPYEYSHGTAGSTLKLINSSLHNVTLSKLRLMVDAAGKNWESGKIKISILNYGAINQGTAVSTYEDYVKKQICSDEGCIPSKTESVDDLEYLTYIPHSILYKLKEEGKLERFFAASMSNIKINSTDPVTFETSEDQKYDMQINWQAKAICDETFDTDVGIQTHRKKIRDIFNATKYADIIGDAGATWKAKGVFNAYDYIFGPYNNDLDVPYITLGEAQALYGINERFYGTPYYGKCIVGMYFDIKYEYIET